MPLLQYMDLFFNKGTNGIFVSDHVILKNTDKPPMEHTKLRTDYLKLRIKQQPQVTTLSILLPIPVAAYTLVGTV
jgi:hypothetical protein